MDEWLLLRKFDYASHMRQIRWCIRRMYLNVGMGQMGVSKLVTYFNYFICMLLGERFSIYRNLKTKCKFLGFSFYGLGWYLVVIKGLRNIYKHFEFEWFMYWEWENIGHKWIQIRNYSYKFFELICYNYNVTSCWDSWLIVDQWTTFFF